MVGPGGPRFLPWTFRGDRFWGGPIIVWHANPQLRAAGGPASSSMLGLKQTSPSPTHYCCSNEAVEARLGGSGPFFQLHNAMGHFMHLLFRLPTIWGSHSSLSRSLWSVSPPVHLRRSPRLSNFSENRYSAHQSIQDGPVGENLYLGGLRCAQ